MRKLAPLVRATAFAGAALVCLTGAGWASTNLLVNGSFETGDFTGWMQFANTGFTSVTGSFGGIDPEDGSFQAAFGPIGSPGGILQKFDDSRGRYI